jgi:hypothetical protein
MRAEVVADDRHAYLARVESAHVPAELEEARTGRSRPDVPVEAVAAQVIGGVSSKTPYELVNEIRKHVHVKDKVLVFDVKGQDAAWTTSFSKDEDERELRSRLRIFVKRGG